MLMFPSNFVFLISSGEDDTFGCHPLVSPTFELPSPDTTHFTTLTGEAPLPSSSRPRPSFEFTRLDLDPVVSQKRPLTVDSPSKKSVEPPTKRLDERPTPKKEKICKKGRLINLMEWYCHLP